MIMPSSSPLLVIGATRSTSSSAVMSCGSQMLAHATPDTPARATTASSSAPSANVATPRSGTDTDRSSRPLAPRVHTSATLSDIVFFSDSASCNRSSSSGSARVSRLPNVRITSSGAWRSP